MNYIGVFLLLGSLVGGHLTSFPTEREPLPSNLFYTYNVETEKATWATTDHYVNIGNASFLEGATPSKMAVPYARTYINKETDINPHVSIPQIVRDSLDPNIVRIVSQDEVFATKFLIKSQANLQSFFINDEEIFVDRSSDKSMVIEAFAMIADTMTLRIIKKDATKPQGIGINSQFMSLPIEDRLPPNALRTDAYTGIVQEFEM